MTATRRSRRGPSGRSSAGRGGRSAPAGGPSRAARAQARRGPAGRSRPRRGRRSRPRARSATGRRRRSRRRRRPPRRGRAPPSRAIASPAAMPPDAAPSPTPAAKSDRHHDDRRRAPRRRRRGPSGARDMGVERTLETAVGLVGGPLGDKRRAGEAGGDVQQLARRAGASRRRSRSRCRGRARRRCCVKSGSPPSWSASDARRATRSSEPDQAEADAPGQGARQLLAEGAGQSARARRGRRPAGRGSDRPTVTPEVAAREELDADGQEDDAEDPHQRDATAQS